MKTLTLDDELQRLADVGETPVALQLWGILESRDQDYSIEEVATWYRSGAETYIYWFRVLVSGRAPVELVLKACIAFSPAIGLELVLRRWIEKRTLLAAYGIMTPHLFAWGNGVILEEYIPYSLREILLYPGDVSNNIYLQLAYLAGTLRHLRFNPLNPFGDLRSRGRDVVFVDFGADLGMPQEATGENSHLLDALLLYLGGCGANVPRQVLAEMQSIYHQPQNTRTLAWEC